MIVVMPDKMNGENHSLVRLFLKSGFMKELDLTKGSVLKTLLQFAVPFLIANLLQALYGGADLFVVCLLYTSPSPRDTR
mgnify:CR=1 FL=1